jgi:hypothetical protein
MLRLWFNVWSGARQKRGSYKQQQQPAVIFHCGIHLIVNGFKELPYVCAAYESKTVQI